MKIKSWYLIRTLIISYFITTTLLLALTLLMYKFHLTEDRISPGIYAVYVLSCFPGGFLAGKAMKSRRFFWGLLTGLLYFSVLLLMSYIQNREIIAETEHILTVLGICTASGMVGGMMS